ncbi:MAG: hypothetical protein H6R19_3045 [Proteobacteria bacterium]|nr:hypothetical protein [Pseudomonadota bacterium]
MTPRTRQLRSAVFVTVSLFVCGMLAVTSYTLWRLRATAIDSGLEISAMHSRSFEDFLTQSLHVTELVAANSLEQDVHALDRNRIESVFTSTLRNAPFLRSISLLDERGRIIASSNPANVGVSVGTEDYLPPARSTPEILRIGQPWEGRDFVNGRPTSAKAPVDADAASFIPITRASVINGRLVTLLVALNPDYFINHITQKLAVQEGTVEILRYDGTLLMSSDPESRAGSQQDAVTRTLRQTSIESGAFEQALHAGAALTTFRASRLYPFVVVTHIQRAHVLEHWRTEARTLLSVVLPALLATLLLSVVFYRRQVQLAQQRVKSEHLQRINATVFDSSSEAILITAPDNRIMSINPAFSRVAGYSPEDVIDHPLMDLLPPDSAAVFQERTSQPLMADPDGILSYIAPFEVQQRCKDGRLIWVEILSTPERDAQERITGYYRISRNIDERKQAEEKLRLAADVFTHAHEGIVLTTRDGAIIDVNQAFSRITGYSREEVLGLNPRFLHSSRHDRAFYVGMWHSLLENGYWKGEIWNLNKSGHEYAEMLTISAVFDQNGIVSNYVGVFSDITERKANEAELIQHRHHLEELVLSRTAELAEARDAAEEASRAKSAFLANMSHELRTPLNGIMGMTGMALRRASDPKQIDQLNKSLQASRHLLAIINDILDLAKIEAGRMTLDEVDFSPDQIIDEVLCLEDEAARAKGLQLSHEAMPALPALLHGDALRLKQILLNYVGNAIKFSEHGRVSVRASTREEEGGRVLLRVEVSDQGIGISAAQQSRLFHAFTQVDESNTRKYGGTGLGLIISRRLANLMGGDVGVVSEVGLGSTFWFTARLQRVNELAVACAPADAPESVREILARQYVGARILVAEDEPMNQEVMRFLLEEAGLIAEVVDDGQAAVACVQSGRYDLILLDLQMPGMNGLEATRAIRQLPGMDTIPILAVTANAFDEDRARCVAAGMNDHIGKPVLPENFYAKVLMWLERLAVPCQPG